MARSFFTVAGMSQTRLGPRTAALSLKVLIVVMFYAHERLSWCTSERIQSLPEALKMNRGKMIEHFCSAGIQSCASEPQLNCGNNQLSPNPLCPQICISGSCNDNCWIILETPSRCYANQDRICSYSNADVCRSSYENNSSACVYASSSPAFCICQYMPNTPYVRCEPSPFIGPPIRVHAVQATTAQATTATEITTQGATVQATTAQATTTGAITAQITTTAHAITAQVTTTRDATTQATTVQATTAQHIAALDTVFQDARAQATVAQDPKPKGTTANVTTTNQQVDSETNVAAIVLGSLFALLLLLVIIGAAILCVQRQGTPPSFRKHTASPAKLSSVKFEASLSINRRQLPEPPKPDSNVEYAYIPYLPTTKLERQADASVQEREGSSHDVKNGQECEETTDGIKNTYFGWIPTVECQTEIEASESQGVSSATGGLPQEANIISCPLTQHIVGNITSEDGYEIPMINKQTAANQ